LSLFLFPPSSFLFVDGGLMNVNTDSHHMNVVSSNCSEIARISVPVSWLRSVYVLSPRSFTVNGMMLMDLQLGTFGRAKAKVDELQRVIAESRRAGH
jgi:large subunit ribosomal protein L36e